jgi:hypothetical protein
MCHVSLLRRRSKDLLQLGLTTDDLAMRTMLLTWSTELAEEALRLETLPQATLGG